MAPELRRRAFTALVDSERCVAHAHTAVKGEGEGARCMRRAVKGTRYCRQHEPGPWSTGHVPDVDPTSWDRAPASPKPLHASPSPSASEDTRAESGAEVPASVKGEVRS
jgi:hypothetical protein